MAERFGGKYSPDGGGPVTNHPQRNAFDGKVRARAGGRVNFLFVAPLPLAISAFFLDPAGLALRLVAFGTLILAAWLTREGVAAQEAYDARKIARRPAFPRKIAGSLLTGAGLGLAGLASGPVNAVIFAVLGVGLHFMAFGPDPMRSKGMEGVDEFQTDRVARAVGEAEKLLAAMKDAVMRDGQVRRRLRKVARPEGQVGLLRAARRPGTRVHGADAEDADGRSGRSQRRDRGAAGTARPRGRCGRTRVNCVL